jgi:membrane associated rhomboid family serine protease
VNAVLLPYRVKNPTKRFPIATLSIIAINVVVFGLTCGDGLQIRESVLNSYAFALGTSPVLNFFTAAFLHMDPIHLLGNMLFFWIFGPPVEDRLGIPRFLALYFVAGLCGDLLQAVLDLSMAGHSMPGIGASGCIMGVLGAYWYLFSWSTVCVFYWFGWFWHGVWEVQALWVIGLYFVMDIGEGILSGAMGVSGGVANFAHVGGSVAGALLCLAMRMKRDTEAVSEAKAMQADMKDLSLVPLYSLRAMLEQDPQNGELLRAMITPALRQRNQAAIDEAFTRAGTSLIDTDPELVAYYLIDLQGAGSIYQPMHLLHLAGLLERSGDTQKALRAYRVIADRFASAPETETALYRMAQCSWNAHKDSETARSCLAEMAKRFPKGEMTPYGRALWQQIEQGMQHQGAPNRTP